MVRIRPLSSITTPLPSRSVPSVVGGAGVAADTGADLHHAVQRVAARRLGIGALPPGDRTSEQDGPNGSRTARPPQARDRGRFRSSLDAPAGDGVATGAHGFAPAATIWSECAPATRRHLATAERPMLACRA